MQQKTSLSTHHLFHLDVETPSYLQPIDLASLSYFHRTLLQTDGTVTDFITTYKKEDIHVVCLEEKQQLLPVTHKILEADALMPVITRQILLKGSTTGEIYTYAASLLLPERLPQKAAYHIKNHKKGIGGFLADHSLENHRRLLYYGYETVEFPEVIRLTIGSKFLSRFYLIFVNQQPAILINERFPVTSGNF